MTRLGETKRINPAFATHKKIAIDALAQMAVLPSVYYIEQCIDTIIDMEKFGYDIDQIKECVPKAIEWAMENGERLYGFTVMFRTKNMRPDQHPVGRVLANIRAEKELSDKLDQAGAHSSLEASYDALMDDPNRKEEVLEFIRGRIGRKAKPEKLGRSIQEREPTDDEVRRADEKRRLIKQQLALIQEGQQ